jgi:hypothetical protein
MDDNFKMVLNFGWREIVLPMEDGFSLLRLMTEAEEYKERYDSPTRTTSYYVFKDPDAYITAKLISAAKYNVAKLAGKPQE